MLFAGVDHVMPVATVEESTLITSAILLESLTPEEAGDICADRGLVKSLLENQIVTEKTIVRLDKKARLKGATHTAIYSIARKRKDPDFKKLLTLWRLESKLEHKLEKKYGNEAMRLAKETIRNQSTNKLPSVSNQGKNTAAVKNAIAKAKSQLKTH